MIIAIEKIVLNVNSPPSKASTVKCVTTRKQQRLANKKKRKRKQQTHLIFIDDYGDKKMVMIVMIKSRGDGNILLQSEGQRVRNSGQTKILRTQETRSQHYQMSFPVIFKLHCFFIILCWHRQVLWRAPQFCIFVYMEGIKSYDMNLEQNLPFSWTSFRDGRKQATADGGKSNNATF